MTDLNSYKILYRLDAAKTARYMMLKINIHLNPVSFLHCFLYNSAATKSNAALDIFIYYNSTSYIKPKHTKHFRIQSFSKLHQIDINSLSFEYYLAQLNI